MLALTECKSVVKETVVEEPVIVESVITEIVKPKPEGRKFVGQQKNNYPLNWSVFDKDGTSSTRL